MMMRVGKSLLGRFFLILALITMGLGIMPVQGVRAANLAVTNKNDSGPGSLRQAIADAGAGNLLTFGLSRAELAIQAADGDLDTTFGTNGIVTTDFDNGVDYSTSVVLQPDGKIILGVWTILNLGYYSDFVLARYMPNGSLDATFGSGGKVSTDFAEIDQGYEVALQGDGKILLAGTMDSDTFELARYNSDGSLDTTFDGDGIVTNELGQSLGDAYAVAVQPDGKIVVVGSAERYNLGYSLGSNFVLVRYNNDGSLDTGFGVNGVVTTDFGPDSTGEAIVIQPADGKIIVGGSTGLSIALARYNNDGSLDTTFDSDGMVIMGVGVDNFDVDLALQPDGKILAAGSGENDNGDWDFVLIRYKSDGSPDPTFDADGMVMTDFGSEEYGLSIAIQPDGRIIMAGSGNDGIAQALARYQSDGSLDPTFGVDGKVFTQADYPLAGYDMVLQPDHNIVVAGFRNDSDKDFALARYIGNANPSTPTVTTITSDNPDPSYRSGSFTVTVQVTGGPTPPSGTVDITGGGNVTGCTITLSNGTGSCDVLISNVGMYELTATYNGDDVYLTSIDTETHTVVIPPSADGVRYVKWNGGGANNGTSWANAYTDLQTALADASSGDEIWVAAGTYKPTAGTDRSVSFNLRYNVAIYGGFDGNETLLAQRNPAVNLTYLSGDIGIVGNAIDNSYHVVSNNNLNSTAVLDGFTISNGTADANSDPDDHGGGIYNTNSSPTLRNLVLSNNSAGIGTGMYNYNSSPDLFNITFLGNTGILGSRGGAIVNDYNSNPDLTNVTFMNNSGVSIGGAMLNAYNSNPSLVNVTFTGNSASTSGGAIYNWNSSPTLRNVTFSENSASEGGAIYNGDSSHPTIINSILYGDPGGEISNSGTTTVTYSIVQGGYTGIGNLNLDPLLGSLANNGGFTKTMAIGATSPAVDAGTDLNCPSTDQRGVTRPKGSHCDIGAYEYEDLTPPTVLLIVRADPNPTSANSVNYTVTFSESVINVGIGDFSLATTGVTGAALTNVTGSGDTYSVTVSTGSGNGTIRLDVVDNDSILNASGYPLGGTGAGNGNYNTGEIFTVRKNPTFADVPTSHLYYKDIEILYANGLTGGCNTSPLKFCPDQTMNRGEAAVFILRGNFGPGFVPGPVKHVFRDDWTKGTWAEPWAEAMLTKGLSAGCNTSPLKYCPWDQIPREQAVIFALRLKYGSSYAPPPATGTLFADLTDTSYYATPWVEQAYKDGLLPSCGTSGGKPKICPAALVSRGLGAYMIVRAKGLSMP